MQLPWSLNPEKVSLQNWRPIFLVILRIFDIEYHGQTSLKVAFVRFCLFFIMLKKLKTLSWENKNLHLHRYHRCLTNVSFHCLSHCHRAKIVSGFDNYHKITERDHVSMPKFWCTWRTCVNSKKTLMLHSKKKIHTLSLGIYFKKYAVWKESVKPCFLVTFTMTISFITFLMTVSFLWSKFSRKFHWNL